MHKDNEKIAEETLLNSRLELRAFITMESGGRQDLPEIKIPAAKDTKVEEMRYDWDENDVARVMQPYLDGLEFRSFRGTGIHNFKLMVRRTNRISNT